MTYEQPKQSKKEQITPPAGTAPRSPSSEQSADFSSPPKQSVDSARLAELRRELDESAENAEADYREPPAAAMGGAKSANRPEGKSVWGKFKRFLGLAGAVGIGISASNKDLEAGQPGVPVNEPRTNVLAGAQPPSGPKVFYSTNSFETSAKTNRVFKYDNNWVMTPKNEEERRFIEKAKAKMAEEKKLRGGLVWGEPVQPKTPPKKPENK
jgi:hypothetical protein